MKPTFKHRHQMDNIRWRGELDTEPLEWSPTQRWLLVVLFIIALLV